MNEPAPPMFIPGAEAAVCADCSGHFSSVGRAIGRDSCPGCGSTSWIPASQIGVTKLSLVPPHASDESEARAVQALADSNPTFD